MKNYFLVLFCLFSTLVMRLYAQKDTLNLDEVTVESPLWQKAGVGQNLITLEESDLHPENNASLASEIAIGTPVNITGTGYGLLANPIIRGTHANGTQVYWNGMPVNSPTLGTSDLNLYRTSAFNQISVIPGGSGTELGGGTMGGAILLNRNLEFEAKNNLSIGGSLASYREGAMQGTYQFSNKDFAIAAGASHFQTENNFPFTTIYEDPERLDNAAINSTGAFLSLGRKFSNSSLESHLLWQAHHRQIPDSRSVFNPNNPSEALQQDQQWRWQNVFKNEKWRLEQGFGIENQTYRDERYFVNDTNRFAQMSSEAEYQILKTNRLVWLAGTYLNYYTANGTNINERQAEYGIRTSAILKIHDRLLLKPALAESFLDEKAVAFLPSLAAEYFIKDKWTLKTKSGKVFSVPTLNQRYWPGSGVIDILPESGWNSEVSTQFQSENHRVVLALYYNLLKNKVFWLPAPLGARPENFREVKTPGAELLGNSQWILDSESRLGLRYSANYSRPTVSGSYREDDAVIGNVLIYIPTFTADAEVSFSWKNWKTAVASEYNNGAYTNYSNSQRSRLDDFFLLHWRMEYNFQRGKWKLRPGAEIVNLLDENYELFLYRPMPGRVFRIFLSLKHQF